MFPTLREIADDLEREALHYPQTTVPWAPPAAFVWRTDHGGMFRLHCEPTRPAIEALAQRYRQGLWRLDGIYHSTGGFTDRGEAKRYDASRSTRGRWLTGRPAR